MSNTDLDRAIAAVLANHAYSDYKVLSSGQLSVGEGPDNTYFYWGSMSTKDSHFWRTKDDNNIMVALRGTSTADHVVRTWPVIGASLERLDRNSFLPYFDFFQNQTSHIKNVLENQIGVDSFDKVIFTGHSMGGAAARVNAERFPGSRAFTFDQGAGVLTNPLVNRLTSKFLRSHIGQLVETAATSALLQYAIPTGIISPTTGASVVSLTKDWAKHALGEYMRASHYLGNNTEHHRTQYDLVSGLSAWNNNTFTYPAKAPMYDILSNHDMEHLMKSVLNSTNMTSRIFVKELGEETVKVVVEEIAKDVLAKQPIYMRREVPHHIIDILGRRNIMNTGVLVAESRANWKRHLAHPYLF